MEAWRMRLSHLNPLSVDSSIVLFPNIISQLKMFQTGVPRGVTGSHRNGQIAGHKQLSFEMISLAES